MRLVWRWAIIGAVIGGVVVPVLAEAFYIGTRTVAGAELIAVWPSSIVLMALEGRPSIGQAVTIWAFAVIPNAILYAVGAGLLYGISTLINRKRRKGSLHSKQSTE